MDIASLFLRAFDNNGDVYLPYAFDGDWTDKEKKEIQKAFGNHVPERVDAMFNNWMFWKHTHAGTWYSAKKSTWEMVWYTNTV